MSVSFSFPASERETGDGGSACVSDQLEEKKKEGKEKFSFFSNCCVNVSRLERKNSGSLFFSCYLYVDQELEKTGAPVWKCVWHGACLGLLLSSRDVVVMRCSLSVCFFVRKTKVRRLRETGEKKEVLCTDTLRGQVFPDDSFLRIFQWIFSRLVTAVFVSRAAKAVVREMVRCRYT